MKSFLKIFLVVWLVMGLGVAGITAALYFAVRDAGFGSIAVYDGDEGVSVSVPVPALPVHVAADLLRGFPVRIEWNHSDVPEMGDALVDLIAEIEDGPDATLVEINDRGDSVRVTKRGDQIVVNVDDGRDRVRVTVPIRTARKVARSMQ